MKIQFKVNEKKALEALLYLAEKSGGGINVYNALKSLFEADKIHLNRFARPVTGDQYIKMHLGTVPSLVYDYIKGDELALASIEGPRPFKMENHYINADRPADKAHLSKSDLAALDEGLLKYGKLSFSEVRELNHKERCWIESDLNQPIPFEKMIDNPEVLRDLEETDTFSIVL